MSREHARFSPSTLEAKEKCVRFERVADDGTGDEGTLLHQACETDSDAGLTEEQKRAVEQIRIYRGNIRAALGDSVAEEREVELTLKDLTYGFSDELLVAGKEAHVMDWKFGRAAVTPVQFNFQMRAYCAAVLEELPEVEKVTGHIVAPRQPFVDSFTFDRELLPVVRSQIEALYGRIADPFEPPTCHEDTCKLCKHASRCPALGKTALAVASGIGLPLPSNFAPDAVVSGDDRAIAHTIATALENWAEQIKKNNNEFAKNGGEVPGYDLKERSTGPKVAKSDTYAAIEILAKAGYATAQEMGAALTLSVPELAKRMVEVRGTKEGEEREQIKQLLGDLITEGTIKFLQKTKASKAKKQLGAGGEE